LKGGRKMRILFVNPESVNIDALPVPPLGILYLASYVRSKGYTDLKVVDQEFDSSYPLTEEIEKADIVAITGTTSQTKNALKVASIAKRFNKLVVFGGSHATFVAKDILRNSEVDIIAIGEGEITFYEILEAVRMGKDFSEISGIVFKKNGETIETSPRPFIRNLDEIPFPAWDLIPFEKYPTRELKRFSGPFTHMMTSRGCNGKCHFCSSPLLWKYPRFRSAGNVFEEMVQIYERYGIKNIHIHDDAFTLKKSRAMEICKLIICSGIDFKWSCQARPDSVDYKLLKLMKEAGCAQIEFGVESGDEEMLKKVCKGYTKEQIRKAFEEAKRAGLTTYGFLIVGLPGETLRTWLKSIVFAKSLKMDSCIWKILIPFPGTRIFEEKLVEIIKPDYLEWRYKNAVIKTGNLGPRTLTLMREIADKICNGPFNAGSYKTKKK